MTIEELKEKITTRTLEGPSMVLVCDDKFNFIARQYYLEIASTFGLEVVSTDEPPRRSIVSSNDGYLYIYHCDEWNKPAPHRTIVITKKSDCGIIIPKLEDWMVVDYAKSVCPEVPEVEQICKNYNYDIYKIENELQKILLFPDNQREMIYSLLVQDGNYRDNYKKNALDLVSAFDSGNYAEIRTMLMNKDMCDLTTFFVLTTFHNKLEMMLKVKTLKNPTLKDTGCSSDKQLNYMKQHVKQYSAAALLEMFCTIADIDYKIRGSGVLEEQHTLDYLITRLITIRDRKR